MNCHRFDSCFFSPNRYRKVKLMTRSKTYTLKVNFFNIQVVVELKTLIKSLLLLPGNLWSCSGEYKFDLPKFLSSLSAITYQMHANQCATNVNDNISNVRIMALYWEYLSIFWSNLASRSSLVSLIRFVWVGPGFYNN